MWNNPFWIMRILIWSELEEAEKYMKEAWKFALNATCERSRCGSIIVKDDIIIWSWFNSPAFNLESQRRCKYTKESYHKKVTDKTCCIHAEQRAIMDALSKNPDKIKWSRLYFTRIDDEGNIKFSWKPYCTICSKMSLDIGISEFVLNHDGWITVYESEEYNDLSYKYCGR